jgi:dephospho-CoA kinase
MRVAITGGIGEGKSTVLGMLSELGAPTLSSDEVAREVFEEPATAKALAAIAGSNGSISRDELRQAIAGSADVRRAVNRLMHAQVMDVLLQSSAMFYEVPLLIEACAHGAFDRVWVVTCGPKMQRQRLLERYGDEHHVDALMRSQIPSRAKTCFADRIVRTNQPEESVRRLLSETWSQIRKE